jgi:hypothetical protein
MKAWYLQVRPDDSHGRSTEDAGDVNQSTLGGRFSLRLFDYRLLHGGRGRRRRFPRPCGFRLSNGGRCGYSALLWSRGLALQLRQDFFNSGGWTSASSRFPHRLPHTFVAFFDRLRWWYLLHTTDDYSSATYSITGYSTALLKTDYLRRRGL